MSKSNEGRLWVFIHNHKFGTSYDTFLSDELPTRRKANKVLELNYKPDAGDTLDFYRIDIDSAIDLDKPKVAAVEIESADVYQEI